MKKANIPLVIILTSLLITACNKELDDLPYTIYADEEVNLFEITHQELSPGGNFRIEFTSIYNQLSASQRKLIVGIALFRNGQVRFQIEDVNRDFFIDQNLGNNTEYCYELAFWGAGFSRKSTPVCIVP